MQNPSSAPRPVLKLWREGTLLAGLLAALTFFLFQHFSASFQSTDFPEFYYASRIVLDGHGAQLYDVEVQHRYQGRFGTLYTHPPFEAIIYLTVCWLPLKQAYLAWCALNFVFLAIASSLLAPAARNWRVLFAASITFVPILLCFLQGQDSILLLLLTTLSFSALRRDRAFVSGCWLGLAVFKFQLAVPLALFLMVCPSRGKILRGFGLVFAALVLVSAVICGASFLFVYPRFLMHIGTDRYAGLVPLAMANWRGLVYSLLRNDASAVAMGLVGALTISTFLLALLAQRKSGQAGSSSRTAASAFATAILGALLVSYHMNPQDLSLLLLPMALMVAPTGSSPSLKRPVWMTSLLALLFLPPLHLVAILARNYTVVTVPIAALFFASVFLAARGAWDTN